MSDRKPMTGVAHACTCDHGSCDSSSAGHRLPLMQARVAAATPSKWQDALVESADADGWVTLLLLSGEVVRVWNHADLTASLAVGQPVALHATYHALALGAERYNVLVAEPRK